MKIIKSILTLILIVSLTACEEVIDVDLDTEAPRLVIDASIDWIKGTAGDQQKIKLTTTTGYYEESFPIVSGAVVFVSNSTGTIFNFIENSGTGEYICTDFQPVIGETYTLTITLNGETYSATETMKSVPFIESTIEQDNTGGIAGDEISITAKFQDDDTQENYYLSSFKPNFAPFPEYQLDDDEFFQGNLIPIYYSNEDLNAGNIVDIKLYGISKQYFDYFNKLMIASGGDGSPFQSTPTAVRGNIINQTSFNNFAFGYFRLSEVDIRQYTIQ
ncbi:DUF4249 domain-containing protein [Flavobacterium sp. NRK F10]|uniref:DUF4249 domain-containing protein n=1 Tax=Flavobacterium sp. NRK F10 TaxID=2954931 RepID=UPI00209010D8|nr:DUF4249 domain-containing protein [Flavobacterium sp. NRK F10]MCO6175919.1 DUF4249 domain-containing protein [Flavobacterium sp. NRK F10]